MSRKIVGSIIVPCYNEQECIVESYNELKNKFDLICLEMADRLSKNYSVIFVDDGSNDDTWKIIEGIARKDDKVVGIRLSHNVGHQNALVAGLEYALNKTDFTITIDADLQQDINALGKFVEAYLINGADVVLGIRNDRKSDGVFKKTSAGLFYSVMKLLGTETVRNHADYRLLSNKANVALQDYGESNLFLRGIITQLGFKTEYVYFDVKERTHGQSKYTFTKMFKLAMDGITSFSIAPLRYISFIGVLVLFASLFMIIFLIASWVRGKTIQGWTSTLCSLWFLCGIITFSIGICGEYIGKTYIESKHRPRYIVDEIITAKGQDDE